MRSSFDYAANAALFLFTEERPQDFEALGGWAKLWGKWISAAFLKAYLATASGEAFVPRDSLQLQTLMQTFTLEKAFYELLYELNHRPHWVPIPLHSLLAVFEHDRRVAAATPAAPHTGRTGP
jgi:predicted trehalose synthase